MLKIVKFGGITLGAGAIVGLGVVGWLYSHRLDKADTTSTGGSAVALNNIQQQSAEATPSPGLSVSGTNNGSAQGAVLGASQGLPSGSTSATPTPAVNNLPSPDKFGHYDSYKSVTDHVGYIDIQLGTGDAAAVGKNVTVRYTGWLTNGTVFDTTEKTGGKPATFGLDDGKLISGWVAGLAGMKVGGVRRLIVPPALGYGDTAQNGIPGGSVLVFDVQLLGVSDESQ